MITSSTIGYLIQRIVRLDLLLVMVVFVAIRLVPGDPAVVLTGVDARLEDVELIRHEMGLTARALIQFGLFVGRVAQGDFGKSLRSHRPVIDDLAKRQPASFWLATASLVVAVRVSLLARRDAGPDLPSAGRLSFSSADAKSSGDRHHASL